jgi:hypothetical protein
VREPIKIVSLASALAALSAPTAAATPIADAAHSDGAQIPTQTEEGIQAETDTRLPADAELMSFTVRGTSDGRMFPQHGSHASHASHASHVSSSPGVGPDPGVGSDVPVPAVPTTSLPAYACSRASNGLGVNQIASELEQLYGLSVNDAVNIAQQALASVLAGGHYCDGYHGG